MLVKIYKHPIKIAHVLIIFMFIFNSACQTTQAIPTNIGPTISPAQTQAPTSTFTPAPSPTFTVTPFPELSGNKPYFMISPDNKSQRFVIYDANGVGRKVIQLPPDGHIKGLGQSLNTIVSPNGEWLVFFTGSAPYFDGKTDLPITLKLLNINNGTIKKVADVITNGYEKKIDQLTEELKKIDPRHYCPIDGKEWVNYGVASALEWGIYSVAWSPDSRMLAFAAQIDGISSDVYLYDVETGVVQQAEDSLQSVRYIRWSPDGQKIIFENSTPSHADISYPDLYVISLSKKVIKNPLMLYSGGWLGKFDNFTQAWLPTGDWLSPNVLLVTSSTPDAGNYGIEALNINTGQLTTLWEDFFGAYAVDQKNKIIAVSPSDYTRPENLGLYFISYGERKTQILEGLYYMELFFRGGEKHRFLVQGVGGEQSKGQYIMSGNVVGIGLDKKPTDLGNFDYNKISVSPDYAWLLMYDAQKLYLYDKNDELVKTFPIAGIQRIFWRPDLQAILFTAEQSLFTLSIPDGTLRLVDNTNVKDAIWLP